MIGSSQWLEMQKRLGPRGRLGIAARLFDPDGQTRDEIGFNAGDPFPMASIVKIPIGILAASRVYSGEFSPDEEIRIDPLLLSPGVARSPIDHLFFYPFETIRTETLDRLLGFMIQRSDNTSSDVLLHKLGGVPAVNAFLDDAGIREIHFKRTLAQLVRFYYDLRFPAGRRPHIGQILQAIHRLRHPFACREIREDALIRSGEDCCTPRAMASLLTVLARDRKYDLAYSHMQLCAGGHGRIRKGLAGHTRFIQTFGHKTGSLGGIGNDAGVIKFVDGSFAAICIMTCRSSAPMEIPDRQIAAITAAIIPRFLRLPIAEEDRRGRDPGSGFR